MARRLRPGGGARPLVDRALAPRLRRGHGDARGRDLRLAPARAVLRLVDDRLGEPHRARAARALARLLARRAARRPPPEPAPARRDRRRRRRLIVAAITFVTRPILDVAAGGPRRALRGRRDRVVLRDAAPVRAAGRAARDGVAVRDPPRARRRRHGGAGSPAACTRSRPPAACSARSCSALVLIPLIGTQRTLLVSAAVLALSGSLLLGRRWLVARGGARGAPPACRRAR